MIRCARDYWGRNAYAGSKGASRRQGEPSDWDAGLTPGKDDRKEGRLGKNIFRLHLFRKASRWVKITH